MAIILTCNFHDVARAFDNFGRSDNFTSSGLWLLVEYMEELSDNIGQPIELDVIAWCHDYVEDSLEGIIANYNLQDDVEDMDDDEKRDFVESYLQDNTVLCGKTAYGFVYQVF